MTQFDRINLMMRYVNNRGHFTISELMSEFNISRSTAIRDIRSMESNGLPITSETGRSGGYWVMHNSLLPAVNFTENEVKALFVAFMATRNLQLPFLTSRQSTSEKLLSLLSESQQESVVAIDELLAFPGTNEFNHRLLEFDDLPSHQFDQLLRMTLVTKFLRITYNNGGLPITNDFYVKSINFTGLEWNVECIQIDLLEPVIIPIGSIIELIANPDPSRSVKTKISMALNNKTKFNLQLRLDRKAILQYKLFHPIDAKIAYLSPFESDARVKLLVNVKNPTDVMKIASWILFLGSSITFEKCPNVIKTALNDSLKKWSSLNE